MKLEKLEVKRKEKEEKVIQMKRLLEDTEDNDETDDNTVHKKKSNSVTVELSHNVFKEPEVTAMLDRTKTTDNEAMGLVSAVLKTGKINGEQVDLNEFTMSSSTIHKVREKNRRKD